MAEAILRGRLAPKGFSLALAKIARRKLVQLNNAARLGDLAVPPGNRLEALQGDLAGKHSTPLGTCRRPLPGLESDARRRLDVVWDTLRENVLSTRTEDAAI